ncbi:MAG: hypothetical protein LDL53_08585 [Candidatus Hydrogenedens sp.]|nr:hypothetical protein [Candidatus Hydrogenedens sp.]
MNIIYTLLLTIILTSIFGCAWVCIHLLAKRRLGERSAKACEIVGNSSEHCCQYIDQCPEEIRSKCKHAIKL